MQYTFFFYEMNEPCINYFLESFVPAQRAFLACGLSAFMVERPALVS